jgi:hypothetical protein
MRRQPTMWQQVVLAYLVSSVAFGQSIPGLNAGTPPKVMVIFDTSKSMTLLPDKEFYSGLDGSVAYVYDDYDPTNPTAPCRNRFCVGKSVLSGTLPSYSDGIQLGLAGYFQYRTKWQASPDSTTCQYDILALADAGIKVMLPASTSPSLGGTSQIPSTLTACTGASSSALHSYNLTYEGSTMVIAAQAARVYTDDSPFNSTSAPNTAFASVPGYTVEQGGGAYTMYLDGGTNSLFFGGATAATSKLFVRVGETTTCPATNSTELFEQANKKYSSGTVNYGTNGVALYDSSQMPLTAPAGVYASLLNCGGGNFKCKLIYSDPATSVGPTASGTINKIAIYADAGTSFTDSTGITYTYSAALSPPLDAGVQNGGLDGGTCVWPDTGGTAAVGQSKVYSLVSSFGAGFSSAACSNGGRGCRVTFTSRTPEGTTPVADTRLPGSWSTSPDRYTENGPASAATTCSATGANGTNTYPSDMPVPNVLFRRSVFSGACPASVQTSTSGMGTVLSGNPTGWSKTCGAGVARCEFSPNGNGPDSTDTYLNRDFYFDNSAAASAAGATSPSSSVNSLTYNLPSLGTSASCPGSNGVPFSRTTNLGSIVCGTGDAKCTLTYTGFDAMAGTTTAGTTYSPPSITLKSDFGPTYTNASSTPANGVYTAAGPVGNGAPTVVSDWLSTSLAQAIACNGTSSVPPGGSVDGLTCTSAQACQVDKSLQCRSVTTGAILASCGLKSDSAEQYQCSASFKQWQYNAPTAAVSYNGQCKYNRTTYSYRYPTCKFTGHVWVATLPSTVCEKVTTNPPAPVQGICNYRIDRYEYTYPQKFKYCRVSGIERTYTGNSVGQYLYSFKSKGGEYLGTFPVTATDRAGLSNDNFCAKTPALYPPFQSECPETIDSSNSGSSAFGANAASYCKNGRTCKLRWRSPIAPYSTGRLSYFAGTDPTYTNPDVARLRCLAPDRPGGEITPLSGAALLSASATTNFCVGNSTGSAAQVRLRSDWYQPALTSPLSTAPYATTSTNQPNKESGWSRNSLGAAADTFIPMGPGAAQIGFVQQALSKCVLPTDLTTAPVGGLCLTAGMECGPGGNNSCATTNAALQTDFTPLYGSLVNAQDYLKTELANDPDYLCRDYYVLLVTDGLESTPANFTQANLQTQVTSMRNTVAGAKTKNIKTFVIGFGAGLSAGDGGVSDLDVIASAGGTGLQDSNGTLVFGNSGKALSATNRVQLESALNAVFSSITAGKFSRSRPTLSTDGSRVYMAYFERTGGGVLDGGSSPEWLGHLVAFGVDSAGSISQKWDLADKLNDPSTVASSRVLKALTGATGTALQNLDPANTTVTGTVSSDGVNSVAFARNDTFGVSTAERFAGLPNTGRKSRLGATVFSGPVLVGAPPFGGTYGGQSTEAAFTSYNAFRGDGGVAGRPAQVLIGSNDGFLRGVKDLRNSPACSANENSIACENGTEAWGVVPYQPLTKLNQLRLGSHVPLLDGTPAVADVCVATGGNAKDCTASEWKTMAVLPLRAGGNEVYGFDVTNGGLPAVSWRYTNPTYLGLTFSTPTIGRVETASGAKWVAFMGGGMNTQLYNNAPEGATLDGKSFFMLDMGTGAANLGSGPSNSTQFLISAADRANESIISRPATYKRSSQVNVESVYYGSRNGIIWAQRTAVTGSPATDWQPGKWFDPYGAAPIPDVFGNSRAPVYYIDKTSGARIATGCSLGLNVTSTPVSGLPISLALTNCNQLTNRQPIFSRPRVLSLYDQARVKPDVFFGTGNSSNPIEVAAPGTENRNMFFAVNDSSFVAGSNTVGQGTALWAVTFDPNEKVLGEPAFVSGAVIVATYVPPTTNACQNFGDSYLYAFDPRTGAPKPILKDPALGPTATETSVLKKANIGAISDLIAVNGNIFFGNSRGDVSRIVARATGGGGRVYGWRRVR